MIESTWNEIIDHIITPAIWLLFSIALVYFLWGLVMFMANAEAPAKRQQGVQHMIWGIVGMFVMVSANAIIAIIQNTLEL